MSQEVSCKLSLGGKVILRRRTAAWEHRERHERRSWLRTLAFEAIVVCLAGFLEPRVLQELVAGVKDLERERSEDVPRVMASGRC